MQKKKGKISRTLFLGKAVVFLSLLFGSTRTAAQFTPDVWTVPMRGNSYITHISKEASQMDASNRNAALAIVGKNGLILKNDTESVASAYVYIPVPAHPEIALNVVGSARLDISYGAQHFVQDISNKKMGKVSFGQLDVTQPQYIRIDFRIKDMEAPSYVVVRDIILSGMQTKPLYVTQNYNPSFGLRGSCVLLKYNTKKYGEAEWTYTELTVPMDGDVRGSKYCAQGFDGGLLSLRYDEEGCKSVDFSLWNAMNGDSFDDVPDDHKAKVLYKAKGIKMKDLGFRKNGISCQLEYPWEAGKTYSFLVHAQRNVADSATCYTAYVCERSAKEWTKIATVQRPFTSFLITGLCSFLENTEEEQGRFTRKCYLGNILLRTKEQTWYPISEARFKNDDTGRRGIRVDYGGGVENGCFYLKTGGYFGNGSMQERWLKLPEKDVSETVNWINEEITKLK